MGTVSDSSQDASGTSTSLTPESSPNVRLIKSEMPVPNNPLCPMPTNILSGSPGTFSIGPGTSSDQFQKRRSSSRSIKRKKFDDEVVESSLVKSSRARPPPGALPGLNPAFPSSSPMPFPFSTGIGSGDQTPVELPIFPPSEKRKPRPAPRRVKKSKNSHLHVTKDVGRWKPADDLTLILAVQQTHDLESVYRGVKFSCKFNLQEIQERWYALLYDPTISKVAVSAMKQLHPDVVAQIQAKALFSAEEEKLIATVASTTQPTTETFQALLNEHPDVFLPSRTPKVLLAHWSLMRQYHLLPDQTVQPLPRGEHVLNFSDAEELIEDPELQDPRDENLEQELCIADRSAKREIRQLENELPKWQVLVDSITGVSPPDFDNQTLAVLRGRLVRYLMRSREITLGRAAKENKIDVDLALEGPAWKVSRKQGIIKLDNNGDFYIINEGKRPIYIDGKPVLTGNKFRLNNNSVVEIVGLRFIFLVNQEMISAIRAKASG